MFQLSSFALSELEDRPAGVTAKPRVHVARWMFLLEWNEWRIPRHPPSRAGELLAEEHHRKARALVPMPCTTTRERHEGVPHVCLTRGLERV